MLEVIMFFTRWYLEAKAAKLMDGGHGTKQATPTRFQAPAAGIPNHGWVLEHAAWHGFIELIPE